MQLGFAGLARILLAAQGLVEISKQLPRSFVASAGGALDAYSERSVLRQSAFSTKQYPIHHRATTSNHGWRRSGSEQSFQRLVS